MKTILVNTDNFKSSPSPRQQLADALAVYGNRVVSVVTLSYTGVIHEPECIHQAPKREFQKFGPETLSLTATSFLVVVSE